MTFEFHLLFVAGMTEKSERWHFFDTPYHNPQDVRFFHNPGTVNLVTHGVPPWRESGNILISLLLLSGKQHLNSFGIGFAWYSFNNSFYRITRGRDEKLAGCCFVWKGRSRLQIPTRQPIIRWRDIVNLSDEAALARVRRDGIHVLWPGLAHERKPVVPVWPFICCLELISVGERVRRGLHLDHTGH